MHESTHREYGALTMKHTEETIRAARSVYRAMIQLAEAFDKGKAAEDKSEADYWRSVAHDTLLGLELYLCRGCGEWVPTEGYEYDQELCVCCDRESVRDHDEDERAYFDTMTNNAKENGK